MRLPDFFIVGAAKAGTTSLYHYLGQHPEIYISPLKEPGYFASEVRPENFVPDRQARVQRVIDDTRAYVRGPMLEPRLNGIVCDWQDYLRLFAAATTQRAVGEASVCYLWSRTAAAQIAARIPHARILMVLRAPADRAFSQYLQAVSDGVLTQSFHDYVRASLRAGTQALGIHHPFLELGFYADQVQRYLDHFPRRQIGIWFYEEARANPRAFLREVLAFLGVDTAFTPDISHRHNQPHIARMVRSNRLLRRAGIWQLLRRITPEPLRSRLRPAVYQPPGSRTIPPRDRAFLLDLYRSDIHRLETILNRDLNLWLT
ncbi:MAG: sulfotransferase [Acidobacteriaceae bacterium]|jgi:hypothetical protein